MKSLAFPFMEPITLPLLVCNVVENPAVKFLNSMVPFEVCSIIFCVDCVLSVTIRLFEVTASMSCAEIFVKAMLPFVVAAVNLPEAVMSKASMALLEVLREMVCTLVNRFTFIYPLLVEALSLLAAMFSMVTCALLVSIYNSPLKSDGNNIVVEGD